MFEARGRRNRLKLFSKRRNHGMADKLKQVFKGHHEETNPAAGSAPAGDQPHPANPTGETVALTDEQGNLKPGPHQNALKREGVFSKIKDKLHK